MTRRFAAMAGTALLAVVGPISTVHAVLITDGNVEPTVPIAWTSSTDAYIGNTSYGSLTVNSGDSVISRSGTIGNINGVTGVMTVAGVGSTWNSSSSYLDVGNSGNGTLNISGGGYVGNSPSVRVGSNSGSTGIVMVDGSGSTLECVDLIVGSSGTGTLNITGGGKLSNQYAHIGSSSGSTGVVTVDGTGSTWHNGFSLTLGTWGNGTTNITGGGTVDVVNASVSINGYSLLAIDVGNGSRLTIANGVGTILNNGKVRILAGLGTAEGQVYSPITATTFVGSGTYQAVGGTWNATSHKFTASGVQAGVSGSPIAINLNSNQRVLVTDSGTGNSVGVSFLAKTVSMPLTVTATGISGGTQTALESLLDANESILSAWEFAVTGYSAGDPAYLSFNIGTGYAREDLAAWRYDGANWVRFAATDLTCNGAYASLTVTGFSGYALTTVPEPGTLALLAAGLCSAFAYAWRRNGS